jgi:hypothetical protein
VFRFIVFSFTFLTMPFTLYSVCRNLALFLTSGAGLS